MKNTIAQATDWTTYYSRPKSKFSTSTQKITLSKLAAYINKYADGEIDIIELGGGNSCFAQELIERLNVISYSIVDNCEIAVEKFKQMNLPGCAYMADLTEGNIGEEIEKRFDVVYSVGLIEHFRGKDIEKVIASHFRLCKQGGIVLISVPTPTLQYRFIRKMMEVFKVWGFPDERPLRYNEISSIIERYGKVQAYRINRKLPLTQLMVVAIMDEKIV